MRIDDWGVASIWQRVVQRKTQREDVGIMGSATVTAVAAIFIPRHAVTLQRDAGSCAPPAAPEPPVGMACWCSGEHVENRIVLCGGLVYTRTGHAASPHGGGHARQCDGVAEPGRRGWAWDEVPGGWGLHEVRLFFGPVKQSRP